MSSSGVATALQRASHAATPCTVDKKKEDSARNDGRKGREPMVNRDSAKPSTIGMIRVMVTTRTECK